MDIQLYKQNTKNTELKYPSLLKKKRDPLFKILSFPLEKPLYKNTNKNKKKNKNLIIRVRPFDSWYNKKKNKNLIIRVRPFDSWYNKYNSLYKIKVRPKYLKPYILHPRRTMSNYIGYNDINSLPISRNPNFYNIYFNKLSVIITDLKV